MTNSSLSLKSLTIQMPRRYKMMAIPLTLLVILFFIAQYRYQLQNLVSYSTRPLWDKDTTPKDIVTHYHAEGLSIDSASTCRLHGWKQRSAEKVVVIDAVLMSSELDLLELRMHELDSVADFFFIVESNYTFTGLPKPTYFADNRQRYANFENKIIYGFLPGGPLKSGESAWTVEARTRDTMTILIRSHTTTTPQTQTLVIMSDVDEIPSSQTVSLLKACDFGERIHLQLKNYLYSFEWYIGLQSWRASISLWSPSTSFYTHAKSTERILADSGWHCSYCFRTIPEYVAKMKGFSHSDRIGGNMRLLDPRRIQKVICQGKDIFGMLPEAYSYLDLLSQMSLEPQKTAVGLPRYLLENAQKFKFFLPGGCQRQE